MSLKFADWIGGTGAQSRKCDDEEYLLVFISDSLFFVQLLAQIAMLINAPSDILHFLHWDDNPFAGESRSGFYDTWWTYAFITLAVFVVAIRVLADCGVACDEYCVQHILFTVLEWLCMSFNVALIILTWSTSFRRSFTVYAFYDSSLKNPPTFDWSTKPTVVLHFFDCAGQPMSLHGLNFECLLIHRDKPFLYEQVATDRAWIDETDQEATERSSLLQSPKQEVSHTRVTWELSEEERAEIRDHSAAKAMDLLPDQLPYVIRIGTVKFPNDDSGRLELVGRTLEYPSTLLIPPKTCMVLRPANREDRKLIKIVDPPHLKVVGTQYLRGELKASTVFVSHVVSTNRGLAKELHNFFSGRDISTFICENMRAGDEFRAVIAENSMYCKVFVMLVDAEWVNSGECRFEFNMALRMNLKHQWPRIVPVVMGSGPDFENALAAFPDIKGVLGQYENKKYREGKDDKDQMMRDLLVTVEYSLKAQSFVS